MKLNRQELADICTEVLENEMYDMTDEIETEDITEFICDVMFLLQKGSRTTIDIKLGNYDVRINNGRWTSGHGSMLSLSDCDGTYYSESQYWLYDGDIMQGEDSVKVILDMVNECWYALNAN